MMKIVVVHLSVKINQAELLPKLQRPREHYLNLENLLELVLVL